MSDELDRKDPGEKAPSTWGIAEYESKLSILLVGEKNCFMFLLMATSMFIISGNIKLDSLHDESWSEPKSLKIFFVLLVLLAL